MVEEAHRGLWKTLPVKGVRRSSSGKFVEILPPNIVFRGFPDHF
jgi:hypothetical protein